MTSFVPDGAMSTATTTFTECEEFTACNAQGTTTTTTPACTTCTACDVPDYNPELSFGDYGLELNTAYDGDGDLTVIYGGMTILPSQTTVDSTPTADPTTTPTANPGRSCHVSSGVSQRQNAGRSDTL